MGQLPGTWPKGPPFSGRWNARTKDEAPLRGPVDCGWIGEDQNGVWVKRDPHVALLDFPHLWPIVSEWTAGLRELTPEDARTKSAYEYTAKLHMVVAQARKDENNRGTKHPAG